MHARDFEFFIERVGIEKRHSLIYQDVAHNILNFTTAEQLIYHIVFPRSVCDETCRLASARKVTPCGVRP